MENEIYIIGVLGAWAFTATGICVELIKDGWEKQDAIDKLHMERNFYKAECYFLITNRVGTEPTTSI
jgi:hypothetical protein